MIEPTSINLNKFTEFGKVKDIYTGFHDKNGLMEFVNNVVMNTNYFDEKNNNGHGIMLKDLSDIHVLVSNIDFPFDKLKPTQKNSIDLSIAKKNYVLGYIWICPWTIENKECVPYHFIQYIDSRISGFNIAKYMINEYMEKGDERLLFPFEVAYESAKYWRKHFTEEYDVKNKNELNKMKIEFELRSGDIKWDELDNVFEK